MSGIGGVFHRDGCAADPARLATIIAAAPHRGPDGAHAWTDGAVGLCHQLLRTTPEAALDRQPFQLDDALCITFDGRLDNRAELMAALGAHALRHAPDAAIVAAAYDRWAEDCAARLLGDFAFAIWDARRRRLFCARDAIGIRPFHYAADDARFVFASELRQVLAVSGARLEPNEGMVGEYLSDRIRSHTDTLYRNVHRLPPAHTLVVDATRVEMRRYWAPEPSHEIRYQTDREYADHFRSVFTDAVACRLRSDGIVGAHLSGGIDSSSVVGATQRLGARIETFSMMCRGMAMADECAYIDAVVDKWKLTAHRFPPRPIDGDRGRALIVGRRDALGYPADLAADSIAAPVRERGIRVVLTGGGGDHLFEGTYYHYAEMLRRLDLVGLVRQIRADRALPDSAWTPSLLLKSGIRPLVPRAVREAVRPIAKRLGWVSGVPDWIDPAFAARNDLESRMRLIVPLPSPGAYGRQHVFTVMAAGETCFVIEQGERLAAEYGIEERHPFFDRRVVEFALALPERQRWRDGWSKFVVRQGMRDALPDLVAQRQFKSDFSEFALESIEAIGGLDVIDHLRIAELGWVRQDRISAMYREMHRLFAAKDYGYGTYMFAVWMAASVELWYRAAFLHDPLTVKHEVVH